MTVTGIILWTIVIIAIMILTVGAIASQAEQKQLTSERRREMDRELDSMYEVQANHWESLYKDASRELLKKDKRIAELEAVVNKFGLLTGKRK